MPDAVFSHDDGAHPEQAMADKDVCQAVSEDLMQTYPGYMWLVGCNHTAGTVSIDLPGLKPPQFRQWGMLLHISTILGPGGQKIVRHAGGEFLERLGLPRRGAHADTVEMAREHGLITDDNKNKSKTQW
jgi:hypothetical protein